MVVGEGFEPSKLSRQIYSLMGLTAPQPHRTLNLNLSHPINGADWNRTGDLLITSQLLYQLERIGLMTSHYLLYQA